jgi:hypothetical protein
VDMSHIHRAHDSKDTDVIPLPAHIHGPLASGHYDETSASAVAAQGKGNPLGLEPSS